MRNLFNIITVVAAIIMVVAILIQARGASLGAAFGGETEFYRTRRGPEKVLFQTTIVAAIVFVLSVILSIISK